MRRVPPQALEARELTEAEQLVVAAHGAKVALSSQEPRL